jgi:hypothetical protein
MRGQRTSIAGKRVDVVVVAARYSSHDHRLQWVQAYERRGKVWGDKVLIDRADLLERLAGKRRVSTGHLKELAGDFELGPALKAVNANAGVVIARQGENPGRDDLGVPLI